MHLEYMLALRQTIETQKIFLCYSGYITEEIITCMGCALRHKFSVDNTDKKVARSVFAVFIELAQNVMRYCTQRDIGCQSDVILDFRYGILIVGKNNTDWVISCANVIETVDVEKIRLSLNYIKELDRQNLRLLHKKALRDEPHESSKGAGLGFIEIAMRATKGIAFEFTHIDDKHSYFTIAVYIG
ncbi:MAG: SiaB family protein kinase [Candidatus Magnetoovum sp. WYHC-5]|nr:SiaB family protein kinase [Candidatus Magnetoovum sp. WYHC-5]